MKKPPVRGLQSAKKLKPKDIAALALFRHEVLRFLNFSREAAEKIGLTSHQYQAMLFIEGFSENEQLTVGNLAGKLFVTHHAAVELVDRMEATGLVRRCPGEGDKRCVPLRLTAQGRKKLRHLAALHLQTLSHSQLTQRLQRLSRQASVLSARVVDNTENSA
jgi:DNA-binding MarR family transcriptional regulator